MDLTDVQVDAAKARTFVLARGGLRERARLEGIFGRERPDREAVRELEGLQNPDGGFPMRQWPGNPSGVDTTCFVLSQLKDMPPLAGSPMASRALAFLRRSQLPDGSWEEPEAVQAIAPHWAVRVNADAAPYLTANAAYTLLTLEPGHMDPIARAAAWLRRAMPDPSVAGWPSQTLCLAAGLLYRLDGPGAAGASACLRELRQRTLGAPELAWLLSVCLEAGVGGAFLRSVCGWVTGLAAMQQEDGGWPGEPMHETESTLQALRVLSGYGLMSALEG